MDSLLHSWIDVDPTVAGRTRPEALPSLELPSTFLDDDDDADPAAASLDPRDDEPGAWADADPEPVPFPAWIRAQAELYRLRNTSAAAWLAGKLDELAATAELLHAGDPDTFEDRERALVDFVTRRVEAP